jgi:hypothetical protein
MYSPAALMAPFLSVRSPSTLLETFTELPVEAATSALRVVQAVVE